MNRQASASGSDAVQLQKSPEPIAIVLAAGEGTRMRSKVPKILHPIAGLPMLGHVLAAVRQAGIGRVAVVVGPGREDVSSFVAARDATVGVHVQTERLGTAHAVLAARDSLVASAGRPVVVLFADTPLVRPETIGALCAEVADGASIAVLGFRARDPDGYGRLVTGDDGLEAIVEHKDADSAQRRIDFCNAGLMAFAGDQALSILDAIENRNAQREFYLTDAAAIARRRGGKVVAVEAPEDEVMGVNDRVQLARAEALMQQRLRAEAMRAGVTMIDPSTVTLSHDTRLGRDVVIEPNVFFGDGVEIADEVVIKAFSHIERTMVHAGAQIGPFARLRPGTVAGPKSRIGNFVETKAATIGAGAKVSHLTYIGDAAVGDRANIGAGTITCNYDGFRKHRTTIGADAFIGSNSALVAPVTVAAGAIVGAGSVITRNVGADDLAVARAPQTAKRGWAARFRSLQRKK